MSLTPQVIIPYNTVNILHSGICNKTQSQIYNKNINKALYWLNWILEWEKVNIKKGDGFNCAARNRKHVKPQYYHDVIWLVWDVIFQEAVYINPKHDITEKVLKSLNATAGK